MEKRLLLAFVLSLVMFVGWGYFLSVVSPPPQKSVLTEAQKDAEPQVAENQKKSKPSPAPAADTAASKATPATPEDADSVSETSIVSEQPEPLELVPSIPEKTIEIKNGELTYTFSSRGGALVSVRTPKVLDKEGQPLELVKKMEGAPFPLTIKTGREKTDRLLAESVFTTDSADAVLGPGQPQATITFHLVHPAGISIDRTYTFEHGDPLFKVEDHIDGRLYAGEPLQYTVVWGPSLGGAQESQADYIVFSGPTSFVNDERVETVVSDMEQNRITHSGNLLWTGFQNKYFASALVPQKGVKAGAVEKLSGDEEKIYVGLEMDSVQSSADSALLVYVGTKELEKLENSGHKLVRLIDYGWFGNKFAFLVKPILKALNYFYGIFGNYGWSIITLTFLIKMLFFPLTHKSFKSMKGMQKVQPYVKIIQERHKDDRQKLNEELMDLYRTHKVNPLGGCLPILLQIPVFIALYHALFFSIELRGAPFIFWIHDLSQKDPYFVTPVVMGATMILQQKMTPAAMDPIQQKVMMMMPVLFTFLFITFPSGLVIYWTVNNILTISQQYYIYHVAKD